MSIRIESPYLAGPGARWLRGNLHAHTTVSDGRAEPQAVIDRYAALGHDFLMLSDHNVLGTPERYEGRGLILLRGQEISGRGHVLHIDTGRTPRPRQRPINAGGPVQAALDAVAAEGSLGVLCHPNWGETFNHYTYEAMVELHGYMGVEIFNGTVLDCPGYHLATDKWDRLLELGRRVWGFANDDAHRLHEIGRGWNVVRVRRRSERDILRALATGSFYCSSGVQIKSIAVAGPRLRIRTANADRIAVIGRLGAQVFAVDGPNLDFDVSHVVSPHVRVECCGPRGRMAWTQPFYIRGGKYELLQRRLQRAGTLAKAHVRARHVARAPKLTGRLDDPLWKQAPPLRRFMRIGDGSAPPVATELRCLLAEGDLFFGLRAQEPLLEQMKLTAADGASNIWSNDSVELFFDPDRRITSHYQVMISAAGAAYACTWGPDLPAPPRVRAVAGRWQKGRARGWSVEVAIPLAGLAGGKAARAACAPGTVWGFHVGRNRFPVKDTFVANWVAPTTMRPVGDATL